MFDLVHLVIVLRVSVSKLPLESLCDESGGVCGLLECVALLRIRQATAHRGRGKYDKHQVTILKPEYAEYKNQHFDCPYLLTALSLTLFMSLSTSIMLGTSACVLVSVWPCEVFCPRRSLIKSMAEKVRCSPGGGRGGGGGGGGGGPLPEGGGQVRVPVAASESSGNKMLKM